MADVQASPWGGFGLLADDALLANKTEFESGTIASEPPTEADPEYESGAAEVRASLSMDKWLFPPGFDFTSEVADASAVGFAPPARHTSSSTTPPAPSRQVEQPDPAADPALIEEILHTYSFGRMQSSESRNLMVMLLAPAWQRGRAPGTESYRGIDRAYQKALGEFALGAHTKLSQMTADKKAPLIPESERGDIIEEAVRAITYLVQAGWLDVSKDLLLCLESFDVGRNKPKEAADWMQSCLSLLLGAALQEASASDRETCLNSICKRIEGEGSELYSQVDVRAWPKILALVSADHTLLDAEACVPQIRLQLCIHSELREWTEGLRQASELINTLHLTDKFAPEDIKEIFNDRIHFDRRRRHDFLFRVLKDAPRDHVQDVLHLIDSNDTDLGERTDEEILLVMDLIAALGEDVRQFQNAYFQMFREWLVGQFNVRYNVGGVVSKEELSPEQICDHIDDNHNHEELLKIAVKELLRQNRKFEAARMLARPKSKDTQVFESQKNDKQLAYLVSLYQESEGVADRFGPIEEECLALPTSDPHLYIDDVGTNMDKLEQDLVMSEQPLALGIWWFWRCLNSTIDNNVRASFIAMTYGSTFVIVDIVRLEQTTDHKERAGKELMRKILAAPHILKVVHDIDRRSLQILQGALIPVKDINNDKHPVLQGVSPVIDLSVATAFVKQMQPCSPGVSKLLKLTNDYLRMEMCMGEALSNFEKRPLRKSQLHYALTLAWCPLMILRVLATYEIVKMKDLLHMTFMLGDEQAPPDWDDILRNVWFCSPDMRAAPEVCAALDPQMVLDGPYGQNPWDNAEWVTVVPRPEPKFDVSKAIPGYLDALRLPDSISDHKTASAFAALHTLTDGTLDMLEDVYEAYHSANPTGAAGGS